MGRKIGHVARFLWFNLGIALLVLALLEGVAGGYLALRKRAQIAAAVAERTQRYDAGADQGWIRGYLRELDEGSLEWRPYVYWRRRPYHGQYLNIDEAGLRRTWNKTSSPAPGQLKVFMFGGSTLWGVGARDEFTIPSLVSKRLAARLESGAWVVNLADFGYVSTQEVIALMLELRNGHVPDVVVFLDGANDAFSAFQNGVAGIPENESNRVDGFDAFKRFKWRQTVVENLALYKLTARLVRAHGGAPSVGLAGEARSADALARAVGEVYLQNVGLVEALAQRYGFRAIFFWQPTVFTKKHLSPRERRWSGQGQRNWVTGAPFFGKAYGAFREGLRTSRLENVYDLSGVFDEVSGTIFSDELHVTEAGNAKIAEVMTETLLREVARGATR